MSENLGVESIVKSIISELVLNGSIDLEKTLTDRLEVAMSNCKDKYFNEGYQIGYQDGYDKGLLHQSIRGW